MVIGNSQTATGKASRVVTNQDKLVCPQAEPPHSECPAKTLERFKT